MTWSDVRRQYPDRWVLLEAINAHSENERRCLDDVAVVDTFTDSVLAFQRYQVLHRLAPQRELYVVHTDRKTPAISERAWLGVRAVG